MPGGGGGGRRAEDDVSVTILTPFVHMGKAWNVKRPGGGGEVSFLRGSDCEMNPESDVCVVEAFLIIYLGVLHSGLVPLCVGLCGFMSVQM